MAAVELSHRYISGRQLPDKAVDLLDTAAARVKLEQSARPDELVELEAKLASMESEKAARERELASGQTPPPEDDTPLEVRLKAVQDQAATLRARWEEQRAAVDTLKKAQAELDAAKDAAEKDKLKAKVSEAREALKRVQGESPMVHSDVDSDVVSRVVAGWTGIPVGKMRSQLAERGAQPGGDAPRPRAWPGHGAAHGGGDGACLHRGHPQPRTLRSACCSSWAPAAWARRRRPWRWRTRSTAASAS